MALTSKMLFSIVFAMGDFILGLHKNIKKKWFCVNVFCLYVAHGLGREKNSPLASF